MGPGRGHAHRNVYCRPGLGGKHAMVKKDIYEKDFLKHITFWGITTLCAAMLMSFLPSLYLYLALGIIPPAKVILAGFFLTFTYFSLLYFVEPLSYFPILGIPGTYLCFLAGSISNVRLPSSVVAQSAVGVEEGSREGAIISTLAIGASTIVSLTVVTLGVLFGVKLLASLPPLANKAMAYIMPALFGGVFASFALRNLKLAVVALLLATLLQASGLFPAWLLVPFCVFGTLYAGIMMEKKHIRCQNAKKNV